MPELVVMAAVQKKDDPARSVAMLAVRRRSGVERRALLLLRGSDEAAIGCAVTEIRPRRDKRALPSTSQALYFAELRRAATVAGLSIQSPAAPYVNGDELRLLGWIAECQRVSGQSGTMPTEPTLVMMIARCAGMLDALDLRLPSLTFMAVERPVRHRR